MASAASSDEIAKRTRKLTSIYDAINAGNYPQALRACEMRDIAHTAVAKALKALALERMGHRDEAASLAGDLMRMKPTEAFVLTPLATCLRNLGEYQSIVTLYEHACAAAPEDVAAGRQLTFAHARVGDFKRVQAVAMRLFKLTNQPEYAMWAVTAMHISVGQRPSAAEGARDAWEYGGGRELGVWTVGDDPSALGTMRVAETLLTRALDKMDSAARDAEQLGLFAHTLVRQGRAKDAYDALIEGKYAYVNVSDPASASASGAATPPAGGDAGSTASADTLTIPLSERAPDEDVDEPADGQHGRGKSPGAFEPVDQLRYKAYLQLKMQAWDGALHTFDALLGTIDADDWAYHTGYAFAHANKLVEEASDADSVLRSWETWRGRLGPLRGLVAADEPLAPNPHANAMLVAAGKRLFASAEKSAWGTSESGQRGPLLAVLLHAAVRLEVLHRITAMAQTTASTAAGALDIPAGVRADKTALESEFVHLLLGYIQIVGSKACCFSDIRQFLERLVLPVDATPVEATPQARCTLGAFLAPFPDVLSMPFQPTGQIASASDLTRDCPAFTWSFVVPDEADRPARTAVLGKLTSCAEATVPDATMQARLCEIIVAGREAALSRDAVHVEEGDANAPAESAVGSTATSGSKKKNKKKAKAKAAKERKAKSGPGGDEDEDDEAGEEDAMKSNPDPHGVQAALKPAAELELTDEQNAELARVRARIRLFTTARQVLRFLRAKPSSTESGASQLLTETNALLDAWRCTLPLASATVGGQREVQEGDDLLLLAVHGMWDVAYAELERSVHETPTAAASDLDRARQLLLESALILEAGAAVSPYNMQIHLAAARCYTWLGANACVLTHFGALRIKYVMLDTLGYIMQGPLQRIPWLEAADAHYQEVLRFHRIAQRDVGEYAKVALRAGNYSQAIDIIRLQHRLSESSGLAATRSSYAHHGFSVAARNLAEAHSHLRRVILTGEVPDVYVDAAPAALQRLRFNDDHEIPCVWSAATTSGWIGVDEHPGQSRRTRLFARRRAIQIRHGIQSALLFALESRSDAVVEHVSRVSELLKDALSGQYGVEINSGLLDVVDTGVTTQRLAVRSACARALTASLRAVEAACHRSHGPTAGTSDDAALASALALHFDAAAENIRTSSHAITDDMWQSTTDGAAETRVLNARALVEAGLLVAHVLPYVCLSAAVVQRACGGGSASTTAKSSKGTKAAASSVSENPLLKHVDEFTTELARGLQALNSRLQEVWTVLDLPLERAKPHLLQGGKFTATVTSLVKELQAAKTSSKAPAAEPAPSPAHKYLADAETARWKLMTAQPDAMAQSVLASYKNSVEKLRGEIEVRLAFLRTVRASG